MKIKKKQTYSLKNENKKEIIKKNEKNKRMGQ